MSRERLRLPDQEGFFLQFARLHFLTHPARRRATPSPSDLAFLLPPVLRGDLASPQSRAAPARPNATTIDLSNLRELLPKVRGALADYRDNAVPQVYKGFQRHLGEAFRSSHCKSPSDPQ